MTHEDIDPVTGKTYEGLVSITASSLKFSARYPFFIQGLNNLVVPPGKALIEEYFNSLDQVTNPPPDDPKEFYGAVWDFLVANHPTQLNPGIEAGINADRDATLANLVDGGLTFSWQVNNTGSSFAGLLDPILGEPIDFTAQATAWFKHFVDNLDYSANKITYLSFMGQMELPATATLIPTPFEQFLTPTLNILPTTPITHNFLPPIPNYQEVFFQLFPSATMDDFKTEVRAFYQDKLADHGYFIASQSFTEWQTQLIDRYITSPYFITNFVKDNTSLASGNYDKTIIINKIYALISLLLNTMQRVAFFQARRLSLLTQWQKVYTDVLAAMKVFTKGDGTVVGGDDGTQRNLINNTINQSHQQTLQSSRSVIGDDAKSLQSNINQTNDAVTQQANMATSLIQELSTVLGSIYR